MSDIEAAGDFVTGAALAHAVEPRAGEARQAAPSCLNCGARLAGGFCQVCGQKAEVHRTLGAFWHDFTHSILHFEGKIWRTLPLLFFKPGALTRRYVHGERARFISPLALFLFSIFLMFAVFSAVGLPIQTDPALADGRARVESARELGAELARARARVTELERQNATSPSAANRAQLADARRDERNLEAGVQIASGLSGGPGGSMKVNTGNAELDGRIRHAFENPQLLLYKMQSNAYKFSWALVLLSLPFVWLVFAWKRRFHLFDHLVFVTYSLCFVTLLLVLLSILTAAGLSAVAPLLLVFGIPLHLFAQLRGAYSLTLGGAAWRTAFLLTAAVLVLLVFGLLLLAMGAS